MEANIPVYGGGQFEPRGMVGRIYVVNHYAKLQTKYRSRRLHGFREGSFKVIPHYTVRYGS